MKKHKILVFVLIAFLDVKHFDITVVNPTSKPYSRRFPDSHPAGVPYHKALSENREGIWKTGSVPAAFDNARAGSVRSGSDLFR